MTNQPDAHGYKDAWLETVTDLNNTAAALNHLKSDPLALLAALLELLEAEALSAMELDGDASNLIAQTEDANTRYRLLAKYRSIYRRYTNAEQLKRDTAELRAKLESHRRQFGAWEAE